MNKKEELRVWDRQKAAGLAARIILGCVFIYSGFEKSLRPPEEFAAVISSYQVFSPLEALTLAHYIPWAELLLGLFVLAGNLTRTSSLGLGILLLSFIGNLANALRSGIHLENCGCFGQGIHLTSVQALTVDLVLLALVCAAFLHGRKIFSLDHWVKHGKFLPFPS